MSKSNLFSKLVAAALISFMLAGCAGAQAEPTPTPAPTPVLHQRVDVGEYGLYINCVGEGSPTVVLDAGLGVSAAVWEKTIEAMGDSPPTRVCWYDRLGLRFSTYQVGKTVRTSQDMVDDLHTLLAKANIPGPYLLVAHSVVGGFNLQLYAHQYPDDVVGLVLVEAPHPDFIARVLALPAPESEDENPAVAAWRADWESFVADPLANPEGWDYESTAAQVRAIGSLGALPLVVLTRDVNRADLEGQGMPPGFPPELIEGIGREWLAMQEELAELSSNSTHIIVPDSTHMIPVESPESIVDAIKQVLAQVEGD